MMVTSWPIDRAASRTRNGNRPFPAISPSRIGSALQASSPGPTPRAQSPQPRAQSPKPDSVIGHHFFGASGGAPQQRAPLRGADEFDQILHFGARERFVLLDHLQRTAGVELRLEQVAVRALQLADDLLGKSPANQSNRVQ